MSERVFHSYEEVRREFFPNSPPLGKVKCWVCRGEGNTRLLGKCEECDGTGFAHCPHCNPRTRLP